MRTNLKTFRQTDVLCTDVHIDICTDVCTDVCTDICTDVCTDFRTNVLTDNCTDFHTDIRMDLKMLFLSSNYFIWMNIPLLHLLCYKTSLGTFDSQIGAKLKDL